MELKLVVSTMIKLPHRTSRNVRKSVIGPSFRFRYLFHDYTEVNDLNSRGKIAYILIQPGNGSPNLPPYLLEVNSSSFTALSCLDVSLIRVRRKIIRVPRTCLDPDVGCSTRVSELLRQKPRGTLKYRMELDVFLFDGIMS